MFVPGRYFWINEFSGLLNHQSVQKRKSVPALFGRISQISELSEPGLTNHYCILLKGHFDNISFGAMAGTLGCVCFFLTISFKRYPPVYVKQNISQLWPKWNAQGWWKWNIKKNRKLLKLVFWNYIAFKIVHKFTIHCTSLFLAMDF